MSHAGETIRPLRKIHDNIYMRSPLHSPWPGRVNRFYDKGILGDLLPDGMESIDASVS